jgi:hypothetical protein
MYRKKGIACVMPVGITKISSVPPGLGRVVVFRGPLGVHWMCMTDREKRAQARRQNWTGQVFRNGEHPPMWRMEPGLALSVMWETAREVWLLTGQPLPNYERHEMPGRLIRPEE